MRITEIQTAGEAAEALRPIAGDLAFLLFALEIIGAGLLAFRCSLDLAPMLSPSYSDGLQLWKPSFLKPSAST